MLPVLSKELVFPEISERNSDGIIALGGDLSPDRLILAYKSGIFPWFGPEDPIVWWSPDPRGIIPIAEFHKSRTLKKIIAKNTFRITVNAAFSEVISWCSKTSGRESARWITDGMIDAYIELHRMGIAHSVETWLEGELAGVVVGEVFQGGQEGVPCPAGLGGQPAEQRLDGGAGPDAGHGVVGGTADEFVLVAEMGLDLGGEPGRLPRRHDVQGHHLEKPCPVLGEDPPARLLDLAFAFPVLRQAQQRLGRHLRALVDELLAQLLRDGPTG
ncbi:MAG: leucyl/phenylalanyl-tRNA--protein transferase, partial [Nitrospinota bacterium]